MDQPQKLPPRHPKGKTRREPLDERDKVIVGLREDEGLSFAQIGERFGLSAGRIKQLYAEAFARRLDYDIYGADALSLLPTQVQHVLSNLELASRAAVRAEVESGHLRWDQGAKMMRRGGGYGVRNFGWKGWVALHEWLGLPAPAQPNPRSMVCPHCGGKIELER